MILLVETGVDSEGNPEYEILEFETAEEADAYLDSISLKPTIH